jgi:hypothetical protein
MTRRLAFCACLLSLFVVVTTSTESFAIDDSEIKATDQIKNNPMLMDILKKMEMSKRAIAEMQQAKKIQEQEALKIQEARKEAKAIRNAELERMNRDGEQNAPRNAFERFVSTKPVEVHPIFWSMFNYQQEVANEARNARDQVLASGGGIQQALDEFHKKSAIHRVKIIELNKEYNLKFADANAQIQQSFDKFGKLPRSD